MTNVTHWQLFSLISNQTYQWPPKAEHCLSLSVLFSSQISTHRSDKGNITTTKEAFLKDMIILQPQTEWDADTWIIIHEIRHLMNVVCLFLIR